MAIVSRSSSEFPNIEAALNLLGDEYIKELSKQLIQLDKVATGNLLRSLDYKVLKQLEGVYSLVITADSYLKFVDAGRKASGKMPPSKPIERWVVARNIKFKNKKGKYLTKESTAFLIARSLKTKDIKPTNVLKITLGNILNYKTKILRDGARADFENLVNSIFLDLNK